MNSAAHQYNLAHVEVASQIYAQPDGSDKIGQLAVQTYTTSTIAEPSLLFSLCIGAAELDLRQRSKNPEGNA